MLAVNIFLAWKGSEKRPLEKEPARRANAASRKPAALPEEPEPMPVIVPKDADEAEASPIVKQEEDSFPAWTPPEAENEMPAEQMAEKIENEAAMEPKRPVWRDTMPTRRKKTDRPSPWSKKGGGGNE